MKGFRMRLRTLALCALLLCAWILPASAASLQYCPGGCSHQAAIGSTHYDTLAEAVTAAKADSTVTLLTDVYLSAPLNITVPLALDLGGKTITADLISTRLAAVCFMDNGSVRNGKIVVGTGSALQVFGCTAVIEADAVLESIGTAPVLSVTAAKNETAQVSISGKIRSLSSAVAVEVSSSEGSCELSILKDAKLTAAEASAILFDSAGKLDISDGTILAKKDALRMTLLRDRETGIAITGGKLISREGNVIVMDAEKGAAIPRDFVTGGTFYPAPTGYIAAHCEVITNHDGTVTVVSSVSAPHTHTGGSATCLRKAVCSICGQSYGSFGSHSLVYTDATDAACDSVGTKPHDKCIHCGAAYVNGVSVTPSSLTVPALGHTWQTEKGTPATCEGAGVKAHRLCKVCQAVQVDGKDVPAEALVIPAASHQLETVECLQATCQETGVRAHEHCELCGGVFVNNTPVNMADLTISPAAHVLSAWHQDGYYHWKTCVDCQEVFRQDTHTDRDADLLCDDCGLSFSEMNHKYAPKKYPYSILFLIPIIMAVAVAVPLIARLRKKKS